MLAQRNFTVDEVKAHLEAGDRFVLRILADGDGKRTVKASDLVRGALEFPENDEDFVLLKSDGIPTYHFAHAVDDHLMGTTHVSPGRGLASEPAEARAALPLSRLPASRSICTLRRYCSWTRTAARKKLSKRDMGAKMDDYTARWAIAPECVWEYLS